MPRPYECVRRAWHSERHHPMRGSLIQEIFRVVNEIHGSSTRRNKEWQEKLPVVVLKAEEIIYSKANSEAEYIDLSTLLDRTNDAIDTIIRRDHSTVVGEALQPCIEAALTLGCIPRRASRSQHNDSPQSYLRQSTWERAESSRGTVVGVVPVQHPRNSPSSTPTERVIQIDSRQRLPGPVGLDSAIWSYSGYPLYSGKDTVSNCDRTGGNPQCDLSLRLGPNPVTGINAGSIPIPIPIPYDHRPGTLNHPVSSLLDAPVWYTNKRSFLGEHTNTDQETPSRKKITNAPYMYPIADDRCPQFGPPVVPSSRRDEPWRNLRR